MVLVLFAALPLQAKSLHWKSLDVGARLDGNGNLHVIERQAIVFDGGWNGGERRFNVAIGQDLELNGIDRIDPQTGKRYPLQKGDLAKVDHYDWDKNRTLRWRSRLPSDPVFSNTTIVYELAYTIFNVLIPERNAYRLDHEFAFADRAGVIEHFTLQLQLDPQFRPLIPTPLHWEVSNIPPGETFGVRMPLRYLAAGAPSSIRTGASPIARGTAVLLLLIGSAALLTGFYRREKERGSFDRPPAIAVDESWLAANLFTMPPEVAGAAWDNSTGSAEVAGLLARLIQEGKLSSNIERAGTIFKRDVLHLKLLVDRKDLRDYEQTLLGGFFFNGRTEVNTDEIKAHYKTIGFDPASKIRGGVDKLVKRSVGEGKNAPRRLNRPIVSISLIAITFAVAVLLVTVACIVNLANLPATAVFVAISAFCFVPSLFLSLNFAKIATKDPSRIVVVLLPLVLFGALVCAFALGGFERGMPLAVMPLMAFYHPGALLLLGLAALFLAFLAVVLMNAMSSDSPERLAARRKLITAREFFRQQLKLRDPRLRDEWYPYLLAFGLGPNIDRWFRSYGATSTGAMTSINGRSSGTSSSSSSGSSWSGGGGAFGGAGASGAWAAAAGSLAAGYSAASSGGGGGGGGGFSSGGGGGGGW